MGVAGRDHAMRLMETRFLRENGFLARGEENV
jgi:hypothetical protein